MASKTCDQTCNHSLRPIPATSIDQIMSGAVGFYRWKSTDENYPGCAPCRQVEHPLTLHYRHIVSICCGYPSSVTLAQSPWRGYLSTGENRRRACRQVTRQPSIASEGSEQQTIRSTPDSHTNPGLDTIIGFLRRREAPWVLTGKSAVVLRYLTKGHHPGLSLWLNALAY